MKKLFKRILLIGILGTTLTSCGLSACDCAVAGANGDDDVWKECQEKMSEMSYDEKADFQYRMVKCVNPN